MLVRARRPKRRCRIAAFQSMQPRPLDAGQAGGHHRRRDAEFDGDVNVVLGRHGGRPPALVADVASVVDQAGRCPASWHLEADPDRSIERSPAAVWVLHVVSSAAPSPSLPSCEPMRDTAMRRRSELASQESQPSGRLVLTAAGEIALLAGLHVGHAKLRQGPAVGVCQQVDHDAVLPFGDAERPWVRQGLGAHRQ